MGYLVDFQIVQGADAQRNEKLEKAFGKCAAALIQMIDSLPEKNKHHPYRYYFDNLFTPQTLLVYLKQRGFGATWTIRDNRLSKECHLIPSNTTSKRNKRGDFDYKSSKESGIIVARWLDSSTVTIASTSHGISPVSTSARYSRQEKNIILVPRPNVIGEYNKNVGGTDQMDENVELYRGKKWWWPIITWLLDTSIHNGWLLHRKTGINMSQLHFWRYIMKCYLTSNAAVPRGPGRPAGNSNQGRELIDNRYGETNHLVPMVPQKKEDAVRQKIAKEPQEQCAANVMLVCA
ncbi:piggyBac transposable element-derived protein 2-like [Schistocerca americana]|uniref:piggyBac transposable element-derived protein 2-like n=1 Tax=Schistocerca americana TaxID=7009 RepID=UPI001F4FA56D|nr:piggyBac transposable element-derived protein 2-like [Schistocerca americana]